MERGHSDRTIGFYDREARRLTERYESLPFEKVHGAAVEWVPDGGLVLDIGAGSGRDAAWFAGRGLTVMAVEPADGMREAAKARHASPSIQWVNDRLPELKRVLRSRATFDLVWISAVWMHLAPRERARAFRKVAALLRSGGRIVISLRHGPPLDERAMHQVRASELEDLARRHGLSVIKTFRSKDWMERADVSWETVVMQSPDDATGALPLLRHIIVNDRKSATYKLALLRVLVRIADSATGLVKDIDDDDGTVAVPLGLVALYWIRVFKPLIEQDIPQKPPSQYKTGYGFVKAGFRGLREMSPYSLRIGARFTGDGARSLFGALRDARETIITMPANRITYPGTKEHVFVTKKSGRPRRTEAFTLDGRFLSSFGDLRIPRHLWEAMSRYATWIEPALLNEWTELMQGYEGADRLSWDEHIGLLRWLDPEHDTRVVRNRVEELQRSRKQLYCLWSGQRLGDSFAIDHCLPFSAWPCNDLWNLFPSRPAVNQKKSSRLPAAETLSGARSRILEWWDAAYIGQDLFEDRLLDEATAALPGALALSETPSPEDIFDGIMLQRANLKRDQQLAEWDGPKKP